MMTEICLGPILLVFTLDDFFFAWILLMLVVASIHYIRKSRKASREHELMTQTKTSKIEDLTDGPCEISGRARAGKRPLRSPLERRQCVCYHFLVEEYVVTRTNNQRRGSWVKYIEDQVPSVFAMKDETGIVDVQFDEAEMHLGVTGKLESDNPPKRIRKFLNERYDKDTQGFFSTKKLRYTERTLVDDEEIYVFGNAKQSRHRKIITSGEMPLIVTDSKGESIEQKREKSSKEKYGYYFAAGAILTFVYWIWH
tara:strand:- start:334 stop:1095 length:762 start_codon:yes stop_codon:yes gene_type:complete